MAFSSSLPITDQLVAPMDRIQRFFRDKGPDDDFKLLGVFPPPFHPLNISFKLPCVNRIEH